MLLDGWLGVDEAKMLNVSSDHNWFEIVERKILLVAPSKEVRQCSIARFSRISIPNIRGKELVKPFCSFGSSSLDQNRSDGTQGLRNFSRNRLFFGPDELF